MIITEIKQSKKYKSFVNLYSENEYIGKAYIDEIIRNGITLNSDIEKDVLENILQKSSEQFLLNLAVGYIGRRLRSQKELEDYLHNKIYKYKFINTRIENIIEKLKNYNYINDEKFAELWSSQRLLKGYGPQKIKMELIQKGIDKNIIEDVLSKLDIETKENEIKKIEEKYIKKHTFKNENEKKWKVSQYLRSKGF